MTYREMGRQKKLLLLYPEPEMCYQDPPCHIRPTKISKEHFCGTCERIDVIKRT